jgi:hypothetical protein
LKPNSIEQLYEIICTSRHFGRSHGEFKEKPAEFFKGKAENVGKTSNVIHNFTQTSQVALEASYELALLAAKIDHPIPQ